MIKFNYKPIIIHSKNLEIIFSVYPIIIKELLDTSLGSQSLPGRDAEREREERREGRKERGEREERGIQRC